MSFVRDVLLAMAAACVSVALLVAFGLLLHAMYSPKDVRVECAQHGGVERIYDWTWHAGKPKALVVCRDGHLGQVK